jgi:alkylation response protein AidB-like acyl-CoA dehydrogenase
VRTTTTDREAMSADELRVLREAVRDVCARYAGPDQARRMLDETPGWVPGHVSADQLWPALTGELGLGGLVVPERFGGADAGWQVLSVVLQELGRALAGSALVPSTVLATQLLLATGDEEACAELLPGIADGSVLATVGVLESRTGWDDWTHRAAPTAGEMSARSGPDGWRLSGLKRTVPFGAAADLLLVVADAGSDTGLFAVDRAAEGVSATPLPTLDGTRPVADVRLTDAPGRLVGSPGDIGLAVRRTLDLGGLALAAEDAGAMRACLEMSVDYAKLRTQFDRPIGSFQAIKHKLADMLVRVELAEAAVEEACLAADDDSAEAAVAAVVAHASASESFQVVVAETIQTHGGIGFTWEHPAHLYFRRAKSSLLAFGSPARSRERLLDRLGFGLASA